MYKINTNKNKILFLSKQSQFSYEDSVDIILSPELYWVRIFEIPIPNKKQALEVVPTFFEDFIDIEGCRFYAKKLDDKKYLCFAYDESKIVEAIENSNLNLNQISSIYFAQNEFINDSSFKISNEYFGYQDDILVKYPKEFILEEDFSSLDVSTVKLSKEHISINYSSKYIDNKSLYILSVLFIIFSFINFTKSYMVSSSVSEFEQHKEEIKKEYKMLPTQMQTKSVIRTLERVESKQLKLRETLEVTFRKTIKDVKKVTLKNDKVSYE